MVILVTGANGQLGQALQSIKRNYPEILFVFLTSKELDITEQASIEACFLKVKPDFCINTAAYTAVDKAETEVEQAYLINTISLKKLAEVCKSYNTTLLHISTDFVFDGEKTTPYTEEDATNPTSEYGKSKLAGEKAIQEVLENYYIVRTSWLYSDYGNNFKKTMLRLAKEKTALSVVNDQIGTPTHAVDLATVLIKIAKSEKKAFGIYHYSNEGVASWYDFAKKIFEANHVIIDLKPIPSSQFPTPAKRPKYSVLDKGKIKSFLEINIKNWENSLIEIK